MMTSRIERNDGLVIEDLRAGTGAVCMPGAVVKVHYRGTLPDGETFDSSYDGQPVEFPLKKLIKGWQEGIPGMQVGGKRKLTVPYGMAYGERGVPGTIPPKTDLTFEIELLGVK
jgi:FKBP-type peptidyl-prolyl cis-trans isomerase FkpA